MEYLRQKNIAIDISGNDMHAKSFGDADDVEPNMAGTDDAERLILEIEADETIDGKIFFQSARVGFVDIAGKGENKRKSVFRYGIFSIMRDSGKRYIFFSAECDIDVVESGGTSSDEADALQLFDDGAADRRIDEHGNNFKIADLRSIFFCQGICAEKKLVSREHLREVILVRRAGFKKSDFHNDGCLYERFHLSSNEVADAIKETDILYYTAKRILFANTQPCRRNERSMKENNGKLGLEIPRRLVDKRLDVAVFDLLKKKLPENSFSRGRVARLIKSGKIRLNNVETKADHKVKLHDRVEVFTEDTSDISPELKPEPSMEIPVLYEDKDLVVINKPAGMQVHPAGNTDRQTVAHWAIAKYPEIRDVGENVLRPGIVHRLDRETSGVLLIAKTQPAFMGLKEVFQSRTIEKTYIALVSGHMPELAGKIEKPLLQRSGELRRFVVETQAFPEAARSATTFYRIIARYKDFDLLEVTPKTGRTHQIRVHLASLGCPVVGDKLYAFKPMRRSEKFFSARQMLHAYRLRFELFSKPYAFEAPLPEDFIALLRSIDETREASYDDEALKSLLLV